MSDQQPDAERQAQLRQHLKEMFDYARTGDAATLARLLALGVPANLRNEKGDTLLMLACYHGHLDAARVLLEHGADPNLPAELGNLSPLQAAQSRGDAELLPLLQAYGAVARPAPAPVWWQRWLSL